MSGVLAIVATVLLVGVAAFQAALAAGAPFGQYVLGGRMSRVLPGSLRLFSAVAAVVLLLFAWVLLARAGVLAGGPLPADWLAPACWVIAAFMALNALGNLAAKTRVERFGFGLATVVIAGCAAVVALG